VNNELESVWKVPQGTMRKQFEKKEQIQASNFSVKSVIHNFDYYMLPVLSVANICVGCEIVSHLYGTTGKIIVLYIPIFMFLGSR
jgi:hypothetical protein